MGCHLTKGFTDYYGDIETVIVNGTDLSDASHDDTVKAFYSAEEPILVEVVRRGYKTDDSKQNHQKDNLTQSKSHNSLVQPSSNQQTSTLNRSSSSSAVEELCAACTKRCSCMEKTMKSQGTQTDCFIDSTELFQNFFRAPSPPPLTRADLIFDDQESYSTSDRSYDILNDDTSATYDMEYEDVTLRRMNSGDRIGLTLCYGPPDPNGVIDIFIGDVEPVSVAGRDGRVREGDQILQINGKDVHTREEAIKQFSESKSEITLLVCRPCVQLDDGFVDYPVTDVNSQEISKQMALSLIEEEDPEEKYEEEDSLLTDTATLPSRKEKEGKDSGVGHDSDRQNEISDPDYDSPQYEQHNSNYMDHEYQELERVCNFRQALEARCTANDKKIVDLEKLYKQMETLCRLIEQQHAQYDISPSDAGISSPRVVPKMGTRLMSNGDSPTPSTPSKSADTSPDSTFKNKSSPSGTMNDKQTDNNNYSKLTREGNLPKPNVPLTLELSRNNLGSTLSLVSEHLYDVISFDPSPVSPKPPAAPESPARVLPHPNYSTSYDLPHPNQLRDSSQEGRRSRDSSASSSRKHKSKSRKNSTDTQKSPSKPNTPTHAAKNVKYPDIAYTNQENLALTIALQQRLLLEQAKQAQALRHIQGKNDPSTSNYNSNTQNVPESPAPTMEWVVKRRSDGSRYVTRRPIRRKILSDRKKKLEDERCGMTTDDDAMSEMKTGRYWSKEERKNHLQKAKEYRKRKELMKNKLTEEREKTTPERTLKKSSSSPKPEQNLLQAKMLSKNNNNNMLSVTTV